MGARVGFFPQVVHSSVRSGYGFCKQVLVTVYNRDYGRGHTQVARVICMRQIRVLSVNLCENVAWKVWSLQLLNSQRTFAIAVTLSL